MIIKQRKIPLSILKLQALLRRLPSYHPKIPMIKEELNKRAAGYKGESSLDYHLGFLEPKRYFIFHDLRLEDQSRFFQIDTLLLSQKFALIIEVKNISGTIFFDPLFNQLIRTKEGKETAFPDPVIQIQRQESQFKNWLLKNGLPDVPLYSLVVISNPQTAIRTAPENRSLRNKVIHCEILPTKISQIETSIKNQSLSEKELKKTIRLIKKQHTKADYSILERFNLTAAEILKGAICKKCDHKPLLRRHGTWICTQCQNKCKDAHIQALNDYSLLIGPTITNRQLRGFLKITSPAAATRLLQSMNLTSTGTNRGRVYTLSFDEDYY
ncbi:nuclease-related domain-containing protein [Metabacillus arenae]|uniref:NERD domain-containing protein n=1 Tax=Metabacillus arenae TaxID=2771434 RepID=A0A926NA85_9BACI|nr:nuclease-related domain-containing protein [Metabacillus arenae]MBD1380452.1 NERD domain-containing protein [Metabacillus arenae]